MAGAASITLAPAAVTDRPALRADLMLAAAALGAMLALYVPALWLVVGRMSADLAIFFLLQQGEYATSLLAQIVVLRGIDRHAPHCPTGWRFAAAVAAGVAVSPFVGTLVDAYAVRLGLAEAGSLAPRMVSVWACVMRAAFLIWAREGHARRLASMQRLQRVQQAQLQGRRALVDDQLRAMQARVDPEQLFGALAAIERLYPRDADRADALFEALVLFLRAAVPRFDNAASMLGHEIALAAACVRVHALSTGLDVRLEADAEAALRSLEFPAGVLLPLTAGVLEALPDGGRIVLDVRRASGRLLLTLAGPRAPAEHRLRQARDSLLALHGHAARLALAGPERSIVLIEVPHGPV